MVDVAPADVSQCELLNLPTELLADIFYRLDVADLISASQTCRTLHKIGNYDQFWQSFVNHNVTPPLAQPTPFKSWRDLYEAHHPHWFIPKHRIWFADSYPMGKLLVSRYDPDTASIVAHQLVASRGTHTVHRWEKSPEVIIHRFEPQIGIDTNQAAVKLGVDWARTEVRSGVNPPDGNSTQTSLYDRETRMHTFNETGLFSSLMLCKALPSEAITEQTRVWPPLKFPAHARTRNETSDSFKSTGHRPSKLSEVSEYSFRLRKWAEYTRRREDRRVHTYAPPPTDIIVALGLDGPYFPPTRVGGGMTVRMPEDVTTFATLPTSCYVPTPEKPYQGIWVGDYSGHGCEFILVTQPDKADERPLPAGLGWLLSWFRGGRRGSIGSVGSASSSSSYASAQEELSVVAAAHAQIAHLGAIDGFAGPAPPATGPVNPATAPHLFNEEHLTDFADVPSGRIEAIKLTGDPHIPRGEFTFIAPDIGHTGFVRVADEEIFQGARIVRSAGHIAGRGYNEDQYTPSQLILVSPNELAQFWEGFGHISFYQRVDLDALM